MKFHNDTRRLVTVTETLGRGEKSKKTVNNRPCFREFYKCMHAFLRNNSIFGTLQIGTVGK